MDHPFVLCDVFAAAPLSGNQLAVFTEAERLPETALQPLARELNFSETSFLLPPAAGGDVRVRIFTPCREWPFAGHPLLGAAAVAARRLGRDHVRLETGVGELDVQLEPTAHGLLARLAAPVPRPSLHPHPAALRAALGLPATDEPVPVEDPGMAHAYVELATAAEVAAVAPDMTALARLTADVGANCFALDGLRVRTRMFAPGDGTPEDPATGSAAVGVAALLVRTGRVPPGSELLIDQGRELGRPSRLRVRAEARSGAIESIELAGEVIAVGEGVFYDAATTATVASVGSPQ